MKSLFTSTLSFIQLLSFLSFFAFPTVVVDARLTVRHDHSKLARNVIETQQLEKRGAPTPYLSKAPHWIAYTMSQYSDHEDLPTSSELTGYNVVIMAFWSSTNKPAYKAAKFASLSDSTRQWIVNDYHSHGISLLVSAFGYGDNPTTLGKNPVTVANELSAFVKQNYLDGVDIDWEDFAALAPDNGKAEKWLSDFTTALRKQLPVGKYFLTHAPVAPWFTSNATRYPSGAYKTVDKNVGSLIDWYNVQFYNQGTDYINCPSLLTRSVAHNYPNSSLFEIANLAKVPLSKLVIGKPASVADAPPANASLPSSNGFMDLSVLSGCLKTAKAAGWNAGAFLWAYPTANSTAIKIVRSQSWPV